MKSNNDKTKIPTIVKQQDQLFSLENHVDSQESLLKINADFLKWNVFDECYRELLVSFIPMLPLLEKTVPIEEADYILYMHPYARCEDLSNIVLEELHYIANIRKEGAEIIVVGKAANAEKFLNNSIRNITFWGDHFTEKLGQKFNLNIKEQYFVYDDELHHLNIWPVDGCLRKCGFCRRTYMDIKFESLKLEVIKKNLDYYQKNDPKKLIHISLRAENLTEYGIDIYGKQQLHRLIDLLDSYKEIETIEIPIGTAICEITPEILDSLCNCSKLYSIALNLEAGSDRLLSLIGKDHTRERAIYIYHRLRQAHPNLKISSTIMLGLPTEELQDILELADLIQKTEPDSILCNYYILAPRQPLAKLPQLTENVREYHLKFLLQLLKKQKRTKDLRITHRTIFKNKNSREAIRIKKTVIEDQKYTDFEVFSSTTEFFLANN